jgi:hypothetical protein
MNFSFIPWGRIGLAAGILVCTALFAGWKIAERRANKLQAQVVKYQKKLGEISMELNEQKKISARTVEKVRTVTRDAKARARRLEQAPAANQCVTKPEVMGEDL